jgi:hypothetical protein
MDHLNQLKSMLKARAIADFGTTILPVDGRATLDECFGADEGMLIFWFNTPDGSTHIKHADL